MIQFGKHQSSSSSSRVAWSNRLVSINVPSTWWPLSTCICLKWCVGSGEQKQSWTLKKTVEKARTSAVIRTTYIFTGDWSVCRSMFMHVRIVFVSDWPFRTHQHQQANKTKRTERKRIWFADKHNDQLSRLCQARGERMSNGCINWYNYLDRCLPGWLAGWLVCVLKITLHLYTLPERVLTQQQQQPQQTDPGVLCSLEDCCPERRRCQPHFG